MQSVKQTLGQILAAPVRYVESMGLFDSLCTVQEATNTPDSMGQVDLTDTGYASIAGVVNVPCMRAPASIERIIASENNMVTMSESTNVFHVLLDGYYPQVPEALASTGTLRAIIDGVVHQVLGVESSSQLAQALQTRLKVQQVGV